MGNGCFLPSADIASTVAPAKAGASGGLGGRRGTRGGGPGFRRGDGEVMVPPSRVLSASYGRPPRRSRTAASAPGSAAAACGSPSCGSARACSR